MAFVCARFPLPFGMDFRVCFSIPIPYQRNLWGLSIAQGKYGFHPILAKQKLQFFLFSFIHSSLSRSPSLVPNSFLVVVIKLLRFVPFFYELFPLLVTFCFLYILRRLIHFTENMLFVWSCWATATVELVSVRACVFFFSLAYIHFYARVLYFMNVSGKVWVRFSINQVRFI